jgi:hypothetical protein
MDLRPGSKVRLVVPENPRLHGAAGVVEAVTGYGAVVRTPAAGSGRFRALSEEMAPDGGNGGGYPDRLLLPAPTGEVCGRCGGGNMIRTGACTTCGDCGESGGCG